MKLKINNRGFTLAEVLISLLILVIILAGGMKFYFYASEVIGLVTHKKLATEIANSTLEDLKRSGYSNLPAPGPGTPTALTNTDDPVGILKDLSATKTVTVTDVGNPIDYKQVDVAVAWTESGKNTSRETKLTTYIAP